MDYSREASEQLATVADVLGEPNLRLDANGSCTADIEGFRFSFFYSEEPPTLFIQARLGKVDDARLLRLLASNHLWGGTGGGVFGLNPDDGQVYLTHRLDFPLPEGGGADILCDLLPYLVGALEAAADDNGAAEEERAANIAPSGAIRA